MSKEKILTIAVSIAVVGTIAYFTILAPDREVDTSTQNQNVNLEDIVAEEEVNRGSDYVLVYDPVQKEYKKLKLSVLTFKDEEETEADGDEEGDDTGENNVESPTPTTTPSNIGEVVTPEELADLSTSDLTDVSDNTPSEGQVLVWDAGTNQWKPATLNIPTGETIDEEAIHVDEAGEIAALTEKGTPAGTDFILIEDSEDNNAKKKIQIGNLPTGSSVNDIDDLGDVDTTTSSPTDGQVLVWDLVNSEWVPGDLPASGATSANELSDVDTVTIPPTAGQVLVWDDGASGWVPGDLPSAGASAIDDLSDVDTSSASPTDGQSLVWNNSTGEWEPQTIVSDTGVDTNAIHDNVSGEISALAEKATPVSGDLILIEDSENSNTKKYVQVGSLPTGATSADELSDVDTSSVAPTDGQALVWDNAGSKWVPGDLPSGGASAIGDLSDVDTSSVAPTDGQSLVWNNSTGEWEPQTIVSDTGVDTSAIHDNVSGEISVITEKATPVAGDFLLIEDSEASNAKKRIQVGSLATGATSADELSDVDTTSVAPTSGQALVWNDVESKWVPGDISSGGSVPVYSRWDADAPPETPHVYDDEFDDDTIDPSWIQSGTSISEANGFANLSNSKIIRSVPSGNFTVWTKVSWTSQYQNYHSTFFALSNSTTWNGGTAYALVPASYANDSARMEVQRLVNGSWNATVYEKTPYWMHTSIYMKWQHIDGTVYGSVSLDGISWRRIYSVAMTPQTMYLHDSSWGSRIEFVRFSDTIANDALLPGRMIDVGGSGGSSGGASAIDDLSDVDTSSAAPIDGQSLVWNDANSVWEPVTIVSDTGVDTSAIHDNVSGEISLVTEKVTPVSGDFILIEDSEDSNAKKRVQVGSLPLGATSADELTDIDTSSTPPIDGQALIWDDVSSKWIPGYAASSSSEGVRVYNSANITVATGTDVTLSFDSERWDLGDLHDTSTNTTRLTAQSDGLYLIHGQVQWSTNVTGDRQIYLSHSVDGELARDTELATSAPHRQSLSTIYEMSAGEYVELKVYQNSGSALNVEASPQRSAEFMMQKLSSGGSTGASVIDELTDVDTSSVVPTDGQALVWDDASSKWVPGDVSGSDIYAHVYNSIDTTLPSGVAYPIPFDSEEEDLSDMHSTSTNTSRLTIPEDGVYTIWGNVRIDSSVQDANENLYIKKNTSTVLAFKSQKTTSADFMTISTVTKLTAGEYVEFVVYQDSGTNATVRYNSTYSPHFSIVKVDGAGGTGGASVIDELSDVDTSSVAPIDGQSLVWNDTSAIWEPGTPTATDITALHDNVSGEISLITEKATPINTDLLVIEDSADSNNKKKIQIGSLPFATAINELSDVDTATLAPTSGQALIWDDVNSKWIPGDIASSIPLTVTAPYSSDGGNTTKITASSASGVVTVLYTRTESNLPAGKYLISGTTYVNNTGNGALGLKAGTTYVDYQGTHTDSGYRKLIGVYEHSGGDLTIQLVHVGEGSSITYLYASGDSRWSNKITIAGLEQSIEGNGVSANIGDGARVYNNSDILISNNTSTVLTFNSERWDDASFHDTSSSTDQFVIPVDGRYSVGGTIEWQNNTSGRRFAEIQYSTDAGSNWYSITTQEFGVGPGGEAIQSFSSIWDFSAGDLVRFRVYQSSGSTLNIVYNNTRSPNLWIQREK